MAQYPNPSNPNDNKPPRKSGYDPFDLLHAPVEPPEPQNTGGPSFGQFIGIMAGLLLVILGLSAWLVVNNGLPLLIVALGAAIIAVNTLFKSNP